MVLRALPSGSPQAGCLETIVGDRLRIKLQEGAGFPLGALVEVTGTAKLYLGLVIGSQDALVVVQVEHSLDRAALAALETVWNSPKGA